MIDAESGVGMTPASNLESGVGIIPSLDLDRLDDAIEVVNEVDKFESVHGYKIGALIVEEYGLPNVIGKLKAYTKNPLVTEL